MFSHRSPLTNPARRPAAPVRVAARLAACLALVVAGTGFAACDSADARGPAAAAAGTGAAIAGQDPASFDVGHVLGDPDAPVAVVEFSDFGCPYCARFARATLPQIRDELIDEGLVRWRYVPVTFGFAGGDVMGAAAECAAREGGSDTFWEVHDLFYSRQVALQGPDARARILDWLTELDLDRDAIDRCMDAPSTRALLTRHNQVAQEWYVRGTPTFLINGVPMSGAMPIEFFRKVFATALEPSGL